MFSLADETIRGYLKRVISLSVITNKVRKVRMGKLDNRKTEGQGAPIMQKTHIGINKDRTMVRLELEKVLYHRLRETPQL